MDFLTSIRISYTPRWLRVTAIGGLGLLLLANGLLIASSFSSPTRASWVEASMYLLGVLLPPFLIAAVLFLSQSGPDALVRRTEDVLEKSLPERLAVVPLMEGFGDERAFVTTLPEQTGFSCRYVVASGDLEANLGVHLNVSKVNLKLFFPTSVLRSRPVPSDAAPAPGSLSDAFRDQFRSTFANTLAGAEREGYTFPGTVLPARALEGGDWVTIVLVRDVDKDFLWDAAAQLRFCQDLAIALSAFMTEAPSWFRRPTLPAELPTDGQAREISRSPAA